MEDGEYEMIMDMLIVWDGGTCMYTPEHALRTNDCRAGEQTACRANYMVHTV